MLVAYMMAFLDKQTLNYAALMGVMKDLHLVGQEYSWSSGMFYFGYLFFSSVLLCIQSPCFLPSSNIRIPTATQPLCLWSSFPWANIWPSTCKSLSSATALQFLT